MRYNPNPQVETLPPRNIQKLFAFAIIIYYGGVALFWLCGVPVWFGIFERIQGVPPVWGPFQTQPYAHTPLPFVDLQGPISWRECYLRGIDVSQINPCDIIARGPANYSPFIWQLPLECLGFRNPIPAALVLSGFFLTVVYYMFQLRDLVDLRIAIFAVISPPVFYALERSNLDLLVFGVVVGASLLPQDKFRSRMIFYLATLGAGILKLYPFALLAMLIREPAKRFFVLSVGAVIIIAAYFASHWSYFTHLWLPKEDLFGMFGGQILSKGIQEHFALSRFERTAVNVLCCALCFLGIFSIHKRIKNHLIFQNPQNIPCNLILCGSILVLACFFSGFNIYYRCIFLLPVLSGFLSLRSLPTNHVVGKLVRFGIISTTLCLYADMVRFFGMAFVLSGLFVDPVSLVGRGLTLAILVGKESLWWSEITLLGAIAGTFLLQSPAIAQLLPLGTATISTRTGPGPI